MRILFLDIDGVLNSWKHFKAQSKRSMRKAKGKAKIEALDRSDPHWMIDSNAVALLNEIVEHTNCKIVISSTWRILWDLEKIQEVLKRHGFGGEIIGKTDNHVILPVGVLKYERGYEIDQWLSQHPETSRFAILDDNSDMAHLIDQLIQTTIAKGLEPKHVRKVIKLLLEEN